MTDTIKDIKVNEYCHDNKEVNKEMNNEIDNPRPHPKINEVFISTNLLLTSYTFKLKI